HVAEAGLGQERATIHMVSSTVTGAHACRMARGGGSLAVPTVDAYGFCRSGGTRPQPRPGAVTSGVPGQASPSALIAACTAGRAATRARRPSIRGNLDRSRPSGFDQLVTVKR